MTNWLAAQQLRSARMKRLRQQRLRHRLRRLLRAFAAASAIFLGALLVGILGDGLSDQGLLLVFLAMTASFGLLAIFPRMHPPTVRDLRGGKLSGLTSSTEAWLEAQRSLLPADPQRQVDRLGAMLEGIEPQLATLDPQTPAALEFRALLSEHLPAVVDSYLRIPEGQRRTPDAGGATPEAHLSNGLAIIAREVDSLAAGIARGDADALAVRGRYLETRYSGAGEAGVD